MTQRARVKGEWVSVDPEHITVWRISLKAFVLLCVFRSGSDSDSGSDSGSGSGSSESSAEEENSEESVSDYEPSHKVKSRKPPNKWDSFQFCFIFTVLCFQSSFTEDVLVQSIKMIFPEEIFNLIYLINLILLILFMYVNLAVHSYFLLLNLSEINTFHVMIC